MQKKRVVVHFRDQHMPPVTTVLIRDTQQAGIKSAAGVMDIDMADGSRQIIPLTSIQHVTITPLEETPS